MTTRVEPIAGILKHRTEEQTSDVSLSVKAPADWNNERFGSEQLLGLVQQTFLSEEPPVCRHVVFSPVDSGMEIGNLCIHVGTILAEESGKTVAVADASGDRDEVSGETGHKATGTLREWSRQLSNGSWFVPRELFWDEPKEVSSADVLSRRLHQLHVEFDFCVIQAPAATMRGTAGMLGRLSDGLVLVLQANSTRRWAAQRACAVIESAHAKLLGTVLSGRTFPIPEKLYRRL